MRPGILSICTLSLVLTLVLPLAAEAQSLGGIGEISPSFTLSATPQYPAPFSNATISFLSSSLDLTNATVSVSVNGKNIYKGAVQPVVVTLGKAGSITKVSATVSAGGVDYNQTLSIQPQDVVLVLEPISSAPPLYPGKPLVPLEGDTRIVAMTNMKSAGGKAIDPSALSYSWTVDDTQIANSSGIGKSTIIVASPLQYRARSVSVAITSRDGSQVGGASLSLSPQDPSIRIYENDPLLGIRFDHALPGSYTIKGAESTLYAAPFSIPTTGGTPLIQWFLDGSPVQTGYSITLRPTGSGQGNASLSLTASAGQYTTAASTLSLIFGAKPGTNFFGL